MVKLLVFRKTSLQKVAKEQKDINDQITLNEMVRDALLKKWKRLDQRFQKF